ncbi:hypothetical protein V1260_05825 [Brachybacterium sp. J144]|uniref:hypothetical protein n=1 Tax=Brachybacterium sp. J144 TaxID=3116487 RepID=UPI002E7A778D|nr:hypothetical protein [Brachybacterium sp. J144]MEE1650307.1 hypothetical protein [Brachybacterium sp. J144]
MADRRGAPRGAPWRRGTPSAPSGRPIPPLGGPLEGTIHAPRTRAVARPRRRGRWLTVGVPVVLGGSLGVSAFMVLGVAALIGGAGLVGPALAGLGIAGVIGGGTHLLVRNRGPRRTLQVAASASMPTGTRTALEAILRTSRTQQRRITKVRRQVRHPAVRELTDRADLLLRRIGALLATESMQSRRPSDDDVMLLEGMAERYIPDLVEALENTAGFLATDREEAAARAQANLRSVESQLASLDAALDRVEDDLIAHVTRSLDVHSAFLDQRLASRSADPLLDPDGR